MKNPFREKLCNVRNAPMVILLIMKTHPAFAWKYPRLFSRVAIKLMKVVQDVGKGII